MTMATRTITITIAALAGVAAALMLLPAAATATVYCVDNTPGTLSDNSSVDPSCKVATMTIPLALETAQKSAEPDSVLIGPGSFTLPTGAGPSYFELFYESFERQHPAVEGERPREHATDHGLDHRHAGGSARHSPRRLVDLGLPNDDSQKQRRKQR